MQITKFTVIIALLSSSFLYSQSGWVVETVNPAYNLEFISYKDTNYCQLIQKYLITDVPKVLVSTNGTASWNVTSISVFGLNDVQFFSPAEGILMSWSHNDLSLHRTNNYGISWPNSTMITSSVSSFNRMYFSSMNSGFVWGSDGVIRTTNSGVNWSYNISFAPVINYSKMYFISQDTGFLTGTNSTTSANCIARTTNFGINWIPFDISSPVLKIDFTDLNTGYAVCTGSKYLKTTNQGINWQISSIEPAEPLVSLSFANANTGYLLSQSNKIFKTTNGGINWVTQTLPQSGSTVRDVEFASVNKGIILCSGGKIMKTSTGGEVLGLNIISNNIPGKFSLFQNYPNPFNPVTNIKFDLPKSSLVELVIYDELGRVVSTLVKSELTEGKYSYDWDASDYPSGVYFYRLNAGDFSETNKMVLIK